MTEQELWGRISEASQLSGWEAQQAALEDVVRQADAGGYRRLAVAARRALAYSYDVGRQRDKVFSLFARCLSDYDRYPGDFTPEDGLELLDWQASVVTSMSQYPEVSLGQITEALDDMERRFRAAGHDLRDVCEARQTVALRTGRWEEEEHWYRRWREAGGARTGDAMDLHTEVARLVRRGDEASHAEALEIAAPVLDGKAVLSEPPTLVWCELLLPLARAGRTRQAIAAYWDAYRELYESGQPYRYEFSGMLHEFCALTGNLAQGLKYLKPRLAGLHKLNRPLGKMEYATSVAVLCRELDRAGYGNHVLDSAASGVLTSMRMADLGQETRGIALDIAARFDQRNGNTAVGDWIRARLTAPPVTAKINLKSKPPRASTRKR